MSKYISTDGLSEDQQTIIELLELLNRANNTASLLNGALIGYAASKGDKIQDILQCYTDDVQEYFKDFNESALLSRLDKQYSINHE